ncbi:MAG: Flp family type IVb pilin [Bacillota bacterium]|nr:hypothetical protein [Candidatus Fermentithermobacillaceae bacterium]
MLEIYVRALILRKKAADWLKSFFSEERGATIAEYAILLAVVVVALIAILGELTDALKLKLDQIIRGIEGAPTQ